MVSFYHGGDDGSAAPTHTCVGRHSNQVNVLVRIPASEISELLLITHDFRMSNTLQRLPINSDGIECDDKLSGERIERKADDYN